MGLAATTAPFPIAADMPFTAGIRLIEIKKEKGAQNGKGWHNREQKRLKGQKREKKRKISCEDSRKSERFHG